MKWTESFWSRIEKNLKGKLWSHRKNLLQHRSSDPLHYRSKQYISHWTPVMVVEGKICNIPSPPHHYHSFLWSVMNWNGHGILLGAIFQSFTNNRNRKRSTTNATWKCETKQKQQIHKKGSWEKRNSFGFLFVTAMVPLSCDGAASSRNHSGTRKNRAYTSAFST